MVHTGCRSCLRILLNLLAGLTVGQPWLDCAAAAPPPVAPPRAGRYRGEVADPATGEVIMKVAMQVPEQLPAEKRLGLLLLFHGFKGHENNYIGLTVEALKRLQLLDQYLVISGKSQGPGWTTADDAPVLRLIRWAQASYPIDARRIFVFGSSNGAAYVGRFGSAHQDLLAGIVGYCGNYRFDPALQATPEPARTAWYFVHGGKDNPRNSRRACDQLKALGYRYVFRQMDGYGHTDIWDGLGHPNRSVADAVRDDWLLWMHALRHHTVTPLGAEQQALATAREQFTRAQPGAIETALQDVARIGGEPGGAVLVEALASSQASIRAAAARTVEHTLYGPAVLARLTALLQDPDREVRAAALRGLGSALRWRAVEATSVSRLALSANADLADRVRATETLQVATRLALLGNFEDGPPIWTLVVLLDDENTQVRQAAFAALEKHVAETFGYRPDLPAQERKSAVEQWKHWCQSKCGPAPEWLR